MNAACIAKALNGRRSGSGYQARCPAHEDKNPSLSIRDRAGKILVYCFGGCSQADVIAALRRQGLWPELPKPNWTLAERRDFARKRARAELLAQDALLWHESRLQELQVDKDQAFLRYESDPTTDNERAWENAARFSYLSEQLSGKAFAAAYSEAVKADPARVRKLISRSKQNLIDAKRCTRMLVAVIANAGGPNEV